MHINMASVSEHGRYPMHSNASLQGVSWCRLATVNQNYSCSHQDTDMSWDILLWQVYPCLPFWVGSSMDGWVHCHVFFLFLFTQDLLE